MRKLDGALRAPRATPVPFRLGTTSFIYPAGWLENVERLLPRFDDVELLFFEAQGAGAFPDAAECTALARHKRAHGGTFSLHTPLEASLASADEARRAGGVEAVKRAIDAAQLLEPEAFVLHVYFGDAEHSPAPPREIEPFRERAAKSLNQILRLGLEPRVLCVETLDYDFEHIAPVVEALDLSVALDVGHLVRDGRDALGALRRHLPRTRLLQWHGTDVADRDHRSLEHFPRALGLELLAELSAAEYAGVVTLEVFREADLERSVAALSSWHAELVERAGGAREGPA